MGGTIGLARSWQAQLLDRWRGYGWLQVTDEDLLRLSARALALVRALVIRGHGSHGPVRPGAGTGERATAREQLRLLQRLRHEHRMSTLNDVEVNEDRRQRRIDELAALLHRELTGG